MTVLKILTIPDPRLKHKSSDIDIFDEKLKKIVGDMYETLYSSGNGIGLAAPQVDIRKRIVVVDLKEDGKSSPITFINPKIIAIYLCSDKLQRHYSYLPHLHNICSISKYPGSHQRR